MSTLGRMVGSLNDLPMLFSLLIGFLKDRFRKSSDDLNRQEDQSKQQQTVIDVEEGMDNTTPVTTPNTVDTQEIEKRLRDGTF